MKLAVFMCPKCRRELELESMEEFEVKRIPYCEECKRPMQMKEEDDDA
jgi:DNA replicative helicase MCM subunit Mcm2 (Cdc46/Mcm family)